MTNDMPEQFCDGIGQVSLTRGMIRIELMAPSEKRGRAETPPELSMRLITSAEGFLRFFDTLDRALRGIRHDAAGAGPRRCRGDAPRGSAVAELPPRRPDLSFFQKPKNHFRNRIAMSEPSLSTSLRCLAAMLQHHGLIITEDELVRRFALGPEELDDSLILRIATDLGYRARRWRASFRKLERLGEAFPVLARLKNGRMVIVNGIFRPRRPGRLRLREFESRWWSPTRWPTGPASCFWTAPSSSRHGTARCSCCGLRASRRGQARVQHRLVPAGDHAPAQTAA